MRRHPKFVQTTTNDFMEIEGYFDGKFRIARNEGLFYDIDKGIFYKVGNGQEIKADIEAKYPDMFRQWQRQEERRLAVLKKQNIIRI